MKEPRILILEGLAGTAGLMIRELRRAELVFEVKCVETRKAFLEVLKKFVPQIILSGCSNSSPFTALETLCLLENLNNTTPVILYGREFGINEIAIGPSGAINYILESKLERLPATILSVLEKAASSCSQSDKGPEGDASFRLLFDSNPFPIWVFDLETLRFLAVNEKATAHYGYSNEEFLAMTVKEIRPAEDIPLLLEHIVKSPVPEMARVVRHRKKDGTIIEAETTGQPIVFAGRRARLVMATNITRQANAHGALSRALNALNATQDGVFIFDSETLRYLYVNRGAINQTGYDDQELLQMTPVDINPEFTEDAFRRMIAPLADGRLDSHFFTTFYRHKEGRDIPVEIILQHITSEDGENLFVAMVRDIRERKNTEAALAEANERALREYDCLLQRLAVLAQASGSARDLTTVFRAILDFALVSVPCSALFISLYDEAKSTRQVVYMWYNGKEIDVSNIESARVLPVRR